MLWVLCVQLDLGTLRSDVGAVRVVARDDVTSTTIMAFQSMSVDVYVSPTQDAIGTGSKCGVTLMLTSAGQAESVACNTSAPIRYVTVFRSGLTAADVLTLEEIAPLVQGGCASGGRRHAWAHGCMHARLDEEDAAPHTVHMVSSLGTHPMDAMGLETMGCYARSCGDSLGFRVILPDGELL